MELTFQCPECRESDRVESVEKAVEATCGHCGHARALHPEGIDDKGLRACLYCATEDLYLQKDFPQRLGIVIVLVGFAISTVFWYLRMPLWTYAILLASAPLDLVLYYKVPDVTICYRCLGQHRGPGSRPEDRFHAFDLAIGERYRQERLRIEQLRQQQPPKV